MRSLVREYVTGKIKAKPTKFFVHGAPARIQNQVQIAQEWFHSKTNEIVTKLLWRDATHLTLLEAISIQRLARG
ncbi:hypothetical protein PQC38_gp026 [Aeromonas phage BUCT695]|uniref:hypothetical protein n=1 Tax=Aeromonas phage BUCT695 TaxID=2908630 RepID=UPI002329817E|nr:hypothetical protein PQC38_gp026 [Aeromonas phage BUCT695]UIW10502.1 hypothetical protein [Aeromonas phage BUCT695]